MVGWTRIHAWYIAVAKLSTVQENVLQDENAGDDRDGDLYIEKESRVNAVDQPIDNRR